MGRYKPAGAKDGEGVAGAVTGDAAQLDDVLSKGRKQLQSKATFTATRTGDKIHLEGTVTHDGNQDYDFESFGIGDAIGAKALQDGGEAGPFRIISNWDQRFSGTVDVVGKDQLSNPRITWQDVDP